MRTLFLALFVSGCAVSLRADSISGWIPDSQHPSIQYRFKCIREGLTIEWRNSYPGAVTLRFRVRGSDYDGEDQVLIAPGGTAASNPETLYCYADSFLITEKRFSMANPPPPAVPAKSSEPAKPAPALPTVSAWIPPARLTELAPEVFASIRVGMKQQEVLQQIGNPVSKLAIPEDNELVESYRYPVSSGRAGIVRFSNGVVTEVVAP
jgi:hypothetical protein